MHVACIVCAREYTNEACSLQCTYENRDFQYVHCVMHKCIMVKLGRNEKHVKYAKNTNILRNQVDISKVGGNNKFPEIGGNVAF